MKVVVFSLVPLWSPHFETELEIVVKHRDAGDDVVVVTCRGALASCMANPYHRRIDCVACRSKCRKGFKVIDQSADSIVHVTESPPDLELPAFTDIEELRAFELGGCQVGIYAASSLVSILRDSHPDLYQHRELTRQLILSTQQIANTARQLILEHEPDLVYVFNGRFASTGPILAMCEQSGIPYRTHDASYSEGRYRIMEAGTVHDLERLKRQMVKCWENGRANDPRHIQRAKEFYEDRRFGGNAAGPRHLQFSADQEQDLLPDSLEAGYVLILNSSEDEFASLTQYANPVYSNQIVGLDAILNDPGLQAERFVIRVHPNLAGLNNYQMKHIDRLAEKSNLHIVRPEEPFDTYALLNSAKLVITFGSTTGIEAVYWGVPSVLIGRSLFEDLGPARPKTHQEVVECIRTPPPPAEIEGALVYAYFLRTGGEFFDHFIQRGFSSGEMNGKKVRAHWLWHMLRRSRNLTRLLKDYVIRPLGRTDNRKLSQR